MKQLTLIRHAKSSWKVMDLEDSWRPLAARGYLQLRALVPHLPASALWLVSPAVRTYATAHVLRRMAGLPMTGLILDERLYESSGKGLLSLLATLSEQDNQVLMVAHSPGLDELVGLLCPSESVRFTTGNLVSLELDIASWAECRIGCGRLQLHLVPAS
ncbi:MAG: SixA phosphatase family protein [Aeromonadaceae bacterium]